MGKALKEVEAMLKFDHEGIVKFYDAWAEQPPEGWQVCEEFVNLKNKSQGIIIFNIMFLNHPKLKYIKSVRFRCIFFFRDPLTTICWST